MLFANGEPARWQYYTILCDFESLRNYITLKHFLYLCSFSFLCPVASCTSMSWYLAEGAVLLALSVSTDIWSILQTGVSRPKLTEHAEKAAFVKTVLFIGLVSLQLFFKYPGRGKLSSAA